MGVIVHKETDRDTDLNRRITADLRDRIQSEERGRDPDFSKDVDYIKNTRKTGRFSWFWCVLIVLALISLILIVTV